MIKLSNLKKSNLVKITKLLTSGDKKCALESLGFVPGTKLELLEKSPFSGPVSVKILGTKIALRKKDADIIYVQ